MHRRHEAVLDLGDVDGPRALRSFDIIQGSAAPRAITLRALRAIGEAASLDVQYRAYAELRQQTSGDSRTFLRPIYLGGEYVEADIRAVIAK